MRAGLNVARLKLSHGTHEEHGAVISDIRKIARELDVQIGVLQDLPGPKVRTGPLGHGISAVQLETGAPFTLSMHPLVGTAEGVSVTYADLGRDVEAGKTHGPGGNRERPDGRLVITGEASGKRPVPFAVPERLRVVDSTNRYLVSLVRTGMSGGSEVPEGYAVVADYQSEGRGRLARRWEAPPGTAVLCSILLKPDLGLDSSISQLGPWRSRQCGPAGRPPGSSCR